LIINIVEKKCIKCNSNVPVPYLILLLPHWQTRSSFLEQRVHGLWKNQQKLQTLLWDLELGWGWNIIKLCLSKRPDLTTIYFKETWSHNFYPRVFNGPTRIQALPLGKAVPAFAKFENEVNPYQPLPVTYLQEKLWNFIQINTVGIRTFHLNSRSIFW
jgi:hypothetical protein